MKYISRAQSEIQKLHLHRSWLKPVLQQYKPVASRIGAHVAVRHEFIFLICVSAALLIPFLIEIETSSRADIRECLVLYQAGCCARGRSNICKPLSIKMYSCPEKRLCDNLFANIFSIRSLRQLIIFVPKKSFRKF